MEEGDGREEKLNSRTPVLLNSLENGSKRIINETAFLQIDKLRKRGTKLQQAYLYRQHAIYGEKATRTADDTG